MPHLTFPGNQATIRETFDTLQIYWLWRPGERVLAGEGFGRRAPVLSPFTSTKLCPGMHFLEVFRPSSSILFSFRK